MTREDRLGRKHAAVAAVLVFAPVLFTGCFNSPKLSESLRCKSDDGCLAGWVCDKSIDAGGGFGRCVLPGGSGNPASKLDAGAALGTQVDGLGAFGTPSSIDALLAAADLGPLLDPHDDAAPDTTVATDTGVATQGDVLSLSADVPSTPDVQELSDTPPTLKDAAGSEVAPDSSIPITVDGGSDADAFSATPDATSGNPDAYLAMDRPDSAVDSTIPPPDLPEASADLGPPPDVTPPDTSLTGTPPTLTNNPTPTFAFASTESGTFECQMDTAAATACSSPFTTATLPDGRHVFSVTAIDLAGNRDPSPATYAFTVDVTAPETYLRGWPLPTTGKYAAFAFTASDAQAGFECSLDSAAVWESCTSPKQYVLTSDGSHSFQVRAVDLAGNRDPSPASATFTTSLTLPTPFPDSSSIFCTDGNAKVDCPLVGASGWGQDGTYLINRPQYTSSAGTVTDAITGLTWEQGNAPVGTWDTQVARCTSLSTNGYVDWRLPSRLEALTIIDAGRGQPSLDVSVFATTTPSNYFWLGQELDGVPTAAWLSDWIDANLSWNGKSAQYTAKCVRGPTLSGTFTTSTSGLVVNDSRTNLTWQRTVNGSTYAWLDALSYCNGLALDSLTGWRLPTVKELQTLINVGAGLNPPGIPSAFPSGNAVEMWTSSPTPANPSSSYTVNMMNGAGGAQPTSTPLQVRCVR
jgi:Protein of unknown function (DUF1566)